MDGEGWSCELGGGEGVEQGSTVKLVVKTVTKETTAPTNGSYWLRYSESLHERMLGTVTNKFLGFWLCTSSR